MTQGQFATTRWSLVVAAGDRQSPSRDAALAALCETYWYPLYAFVRRRGSSFHDAQDLTQGFFSRVLERGYFAQADRERGKFRTFLLAAFRHFLSHEAERARAQKRGGQHRILSLDFDEGESRYQNEPSDLLTPERIFERRWALTILAVVFDRLGDTYREAGREPLFEALRPTLTGEGSAPYREIAESLGLSETAVKVSAHRLRKDFRDLLRSEIAQTVSRPDEIDGEIQHLIQAIS